MATSFTVTRRAFLGAAAAGLGAVVAACRAPPRRWRFFTDPEARLVEAVAEQIVPADDDPGATDAGVVNFIDRQLVGPYREHQETYRAGLVGVEQTSRALFGASFEALAWDEQTAVLRALEADDAPGAAWRTVSPAAFLSLLVDHTLQGFYGPPRHGGNRYYVSYRMIGLDYPQVIGQNRYGADGLPPILHGYERG